MEELEIGKIFIKKFIDDMNFDNRFDYLLMLSLYLKKNGFYEINSHFLNEMAKYINKSETDKRDIITQGIIFDIELAFRISPNMTKE